MYKKLSEVFVLFLMVLIMVIIGSTCIAADYRAIDLGTLGGSISCLMR